MSCQICGNTENIVNHHTSYDPEKIIKVCCSCHRKIHNKTKIIRPKNFNSKLLKINPSAKIYYEDWVKLSRFKIETNAHSLADVVHKMIEKEKL